MGHCIKRLLLSCFLILGLISTAYAQGASVVSPYPNINVYVISGSIEKSIVKGVLTVDLVFENMTDEDVDICIKKGMFVAYDDCGNKYEPAGINVYYGNMVEMIGLGNNQFDFISCNPIKVRVEIYNVNALANEMKRIYFHFNIPQWNIETGNSKDCITIKDIEIRR